MKIGVKSYSSIILSVYLIIFFILGATVFTRPDIIILFIYYVIGGWILFSGINRSINLLESPKENSEFIVYIILSLLLIGVGLYSILESNLSFKTIGLFLMVYSTIEILGYIFNKQNAYIQEEIIIETNDNKVIDAVIIEDKNKKLYIGLFLKCITLL